MDEAAQKAVRDQIYRPLNTATKQIRLLRLEPGSGDDPLRCSFVYTDFVSEDVLDYETISYVWGKVTTGGHVLLDEQALDVPHSSEAALRITRLPDVPRTLWIDAICINQKDTNERTQQVRLMGQIYGSGQANLVHFAEDADRAYPTLKLIAHFWDNADISRPGVDLSYLVEDDGVTLRSNWAETTGEKVFATPLELRNFAVNSPEIKLSDSRYRYGQSCKAYVDRKTWSAVVDNEDVWHALFEHAWSKRVWVMQEYVRAKCNVLYWGNCAADFDQVVGFAATVLDAGGLPVTALFSATTARRMAVQRVATISIHGRDSGLVQTMLKVFSMARCMDIRDKVFGIAGIFENEGVLPGLWKLLEPDYAKSPLMVLRDGMRASMYKDVSWLNATSGEWGSALGFTELTGAPSWVTCWYSMYREWPQNRTKPPVIFHTFKASGNFTLPDRAALGRADQDPDVLELAGLVVDHVAEVSPRLVQSITKETKAFTLWALHALMVATSMPEPSFVAIAATMMAEGVETMSPETRKSLEKCGGHLWRDLYRTCFGRDHRVLRRFKDCDADLRSPSPEESLRFYENASYYCNSRCGFVTSGYFGIGPSTMLPGDVLVILAGGDSPYILRERPDEPGYYTFIGACYVHGLMYGEAVKQYEGLRRLPHTFKLR